MTELDKLQYEARLRHLKFVQLKKKVGRPRKPKPVKPQFDIEKIKQFIDSKEKQPKKPKVIMPSEDLFKPEQPYRRPPAKYSNRNVLNEYL